MLLKKQRVIFMSAIQSDHHNTTVVSSGLDQTDAHGPNTQVQLTIIGVRPMNYNQQEECHFVNPAQLHAAADQPPLQTSNFSTHYSESRHLAYLSSNSTIIQPSMSQTTITVTDQVGRGAVPVTRPSVSRCRTFCVISIAAAVSVICSVAFYFGVEKDSNCLLRGFFSSLIIDIPVLCFGLSRRRCHCCCKC